MGDKLRDRLFSCVKRAKIQNVCTHSHSRAFFISFSKTLNRSSCNGTRELLRTRRFYGFYAWFIRFKVSPPPPPPPLSRWPSQFVFFPPSSEEIARSDSAEFVPKWWCHFCAAVAWSIRGSGSFTSTSSCLRRPADDDTKSDHRFCVPGVDSLAIVFWPAFRQVFASLARRPTSLWTFKWQGSWAFRSSFVSKTSLRKNKGKFPTTSPGGLVFLFCFFLESAALNYQQRRSDRFKQLKLLQNQVAK